MKTFYSVELEATMIHSFRKISRTEKGELMKYIVICTLYNGNVILAFASTFTSATEIADMFIHGDYTSSVEIITLATKARTRYIY